MLAVYFAILSVVTLQARQNLKFECGLCLKLNAQMLLCILSDGPYDVIVHNNNHVDLLVSQIFGELVKNHCWREAVATMHIIAMKL